MRPSIVNERLEQQASLHLLREIVYFLQIFPGNLRKIVFWKKDAKWYQEINFLGTTLASVCPLDDKNAQIYFTRVKKIRTQWTIMLFMKHALNEVTQQMR